RPCRAARPGGLRRRGRWRRWRGSGWRGPAASERVRTWTALCVEGRSGEPGLDPRRERTAADAVAVVQRRQRAGVEERVGQAGELEARGLDAMAQQRARH